MSIKVSLVIPVYNEAGHLAEFLGQIDSLTLDVTTELVIVDDASTDGSGDIIESFHFRSPVVKYRRKKNRGKGAAIQKGLELATGDIIGIQDADFEYDMRDIATLIEPLLEGRADAVFGSRFKKNTEQVHRTYHYLVNRILTLLSNLCTGLYLTDMETCYKFFRRDLITNIKLESRRFGFEPEVTAKLAKLRLRVVELPISYFPRNYLQGKKITWKDGIAALRHIFYYNFAVKPTQWIKGTLPEKYLPKGSNWL
jgi:glycosyltransferase involved in cell wall biosynthesis